MFQIKQYSGSYMYSIKQLTELLVQLNFVHSNSDRSNTSLARTYSEYHTYSVKKTTKVAGQHVLNK
jgi:hypothetical protein